MKLLPINDSYRNWLFEKNALRFDAMLNEHLIGLTYEESIFFLALSSPSSPRWNDWSAPDLEKFVQCYERHTIALKFSSFNPYAQ